VIPRLANLHQGQFSSMNPERRPPLRRPCQCLSCRDGAGAHRDRCRRLFSASASGIPFPCCPQPARPRPLGEQSLQEWSTKTMRTGDLPRHIDAGALQSSLLCWQVLVVGLGSTQSIKERCPKARSGAGIQGAQLGFSVSHDRLWRYDNRLAPFPPRQEPDEP
jgi:hypothetical protein